MVSSRWASAATAEKEETPGDPDLRAPVQLLLRAAPQRRVAGVDPGHVQPLGVGPPVDGDDLLQGHGRGVQDLRVRARVLKDLRLDQARRPDHHVRLRDGARGAERQQIGGAGAGTDERHLAGGGIGHGEGPLVRDHG
jgi:hypothetical protein